MVPQPGPSHSYQWTPPEVLLVVVMAVVMAVVVLMAVLLVVVAVAVRGGG